MNKKSISVGKHACTSVNIAYEDCKSAALKLAPIIELCCDGDKMQLQTILPAFSTLLNVSYFQLLSFYSWYLGCMSI